MRSHYIYDDIVTNVDGIPCGHKGCAQHTKTPCEGCGRIAMHARREPITFMGEDGIPRKSDYGQSRDDGITDLLMMAMHSAVKTGDTDIVDNTIAASMPGGIEAQEARGQQHMCKTSALPRRILNGVEGVDPRKPFEDLGIKFKDNVDDLFVRVEMPEGWDIKPTDHSMWSDLVDTQGKVITQIFYKAAFYNRSAHMFVPKG